MEEENKQKSKSNLWATGVPVAATIFSLAQLMVNIHSLTDQNKRDKTESFNRIVHPLNSKRIAKGQEYISPVDNFKLTVPFELMVMTPSDSMVFWGISIDSSQAAVTIQKTRYNKKLDLVSNWRRREPSREKVGLTEIDKTDSTTTWAVENDAAQSKIIKVVRRNDHLYFLTGSIPAANNNKVDLLTMFESFRFVKMNTGVVIQKKAK